MSNDLAAIAAAPRQVRIEQRLRHAMLLLLALFVFTLPLVEAPKNLALALYLVVWCARALVSGDFGGRWDRFDTGFAVLLGSAMLSAYGGYTGDISGVGRVVGVAWLVKRAPFSGKEGRFLAAAACLGLLVALPVGAIPFILRKTQFLQLPSVGHVNQSAIYMALLAAAAFGWWLQGAHAGQGGWRRWGLGACATLFGTALLVSASRAAILGGAAAALVVLLTVGVGNAAAGGGRVLRRAALVFAGVAAVVIGVAVLAPQLSAEKLTPAELVHTKSMASRMQNWRLAYEGWRHRPFLGHGPDAYQQIRVSDVCAWRAERGQDCDPSRYLSAPHAHSLYVATLVERGLLGAAALALFVGLWAHGLIRSIRTAPVSGLWIGSAVALVVVTVVGLFNTTLRVEHGSLALLWMALWVAAQRPQAPPTPAD
jgi:O-antigen ligase